MFSLFSDDEQPSCSYSPRIDGNTWELVKECWLRKSSERPTMDKIVESHVSRPDSLLTTLITEVRASKSDVLLLMIAS